MSELQAYRWCYKCHGLEIYFGYCGVTLTIEGQQFYSESIIDAVALAIKAGF